MKIHSIKYAVRHATCCLSGHCINFRHSCSQGNLYIAEEDIKTIPRFASETLIAVRAPHGTTLEVPDPDDGLDFPNKRYQILLKSGSGSVEVFLISLHESERESSHRGSRPVHRDSLKPLGESIHANHSDASNDGELARESEQPPLVLNSHIPSKKLSYDALHADSEDAGSAIVRVMPRSCEPDYFFAEDGHDFSLGLHEIFAIAGLDGYFLDDQISY